MKLISKKLQFAFKKTATIALFITEEALKNKSGFFPDKFPFILQNSNLDFYKAKVNEIIFLPFSQFPNVLICGLGSEEDINMEILRNGAANVTAEANKNKIKNLCIIVPPIKNINKHDLDQSLAEGIILTNYSFNKYKSLESKSEESLLDTAYIYTDYRDSEEIFKEVETVAQNTLLCRDFVNETTDECNPLSFSKEAKKISQLKNLSCKIYGKEELKKLKMGLLLAVNQGSSVPPQLIVLKYTGNPKSKKNFALVGKGITFDSGGLNLKPTGSMETMRMDMSGAATVLFAIKSIAELGLKKNVYAVMPVTDNMVSSTAYKPGNIYSSYSGKSVEIGNTDAEGRLILADAIAFAEDKLKPECIVDMATLTGACLIALGETVAAMLSTDDELAEIIEDAAEFTGDKIWRLPLYSDYDDNMKSDIADIKNTSSDRNAGTINGAVFLKNFIKDTKWAHIDIAGTAWYSKARGYRPKNATGYGVRLLVEVIKNWKS